jgi:hypothetical protein
MIRLDIAVVTGSEQDGGEGAHGSIQRSSVWA